MTASSHVGVVENDGPHQAHCSCGWWGPIRERHILAAADMRAHLAPAQPEPEHAPCCSTTWGPRRSCDCGAVEDASPTCGPLGLCQRFANGGVWCSDSCEIRTSPQAHVAWFARLRAHIFGRSNSVVSGSDAR